MAEPTAVSVRPATEADLGAVAGIYDHYVSHTSITFDTEPKPAAEWRSALYRRLLDEDLPRTQFHKVYAGITQPNEASVRLHERFGFVREGLFTEVGRKFGQWHDVAWYAKPLH